MILTMEVALRRYMMFKYLVIFISLTTISCSSFYSVNEDGAKSPGYQYSRQWDERSLKAGFREH